MSSKKAALFEKETNKWDQMGTVGDQMVPHLPARNPVKGQVILCWDVHLLNCGTILMQTRPKLFGLNLCHTGNQNSNQTMLSFSAVRNILGFASSAGSMVVVVVVGGLKLAIMSSLGAERPEVASLVPAPVPKSAVHT